LKNNLVHTARTLRKRQTDAEELLWRHLRSKQMEGLRFKRQQPIGDYVVDFICLEKSLLIEVDGGQHADNREDEEIDAWLTSEAFKVLRFWNNEVLTDPEGVSGVIRESCSNHPPFISPSPNPSPQGPALKGGEI
jgi:very-short-patch-repair endonuclease